MTTKTCPKCNTTKPLDGFPANRTRKGGYGAYCKVCANQAKRQSITEHRDRHLAGKHKYYIAHKAEYKAYKLQYEALNQAEIAQQRREYRMVNAERLSIYKREYRENNLDGHRVQEQNRRARKRNATGKYSTADIHTLYSAQSGLCAYCGRPISDGYHIEHVIPLVRGGTNEIANIVLSCPKCNMRKGTKMPDEFLAVIETYGD